MDASERAAQIWPVLVLAAHNRQTLTYDLLGQIIGVPHFGLGQLLEPIQAYCQAHKPLELPPLTSLVVGKDDGMPGSGFIAASDIPLAHARVFNYDWLGERTPMPDDLRAAKP